MSCVETHRLALDPHRAVGGLQHDGDVLAERLQPAQPRRLDARGPGSVAVAGEHVALVERRLAVRPRRVGDVAERAPAGEQRRLPAVAPESLQLADALAPDAQSAAGERVLRRRRPAATPTPGTVARSAGHPSGRPPGTSRAGSPTSRRARPAPTAAPPVSASTSNLTSTKGPALRPSDQVRRRRLHRLAVESHSSTYRIRAHSVNASGPAPSTVGRPSGPSTGRLGASSRNRNTRPSGKRHVDLNLVRVPVGRRPPRCRPGAARARRVSSNTQKLTESRISGLSGPLGEQQFRAPGRCRRSDRLPCAVIHPFSCRPALRVFDVRRRTAAGRARSPARSPRRRPSTLGSRFSALCAHQVRMPASNSLGDRLARARRTSARTSPTGSAAIARKSMSKNRSSAPPVRGTCSARSHPDRPLGDVQLAEVAAVDVVAEPADDVGVDVGHGQQHVGRIAVGHDEAGVREDRVEVVQRQHVRRRLQPPRPRRLAPLQQLEHAPLVGVGRREVGPLDEAIVSTSGCGRRPGRSAT